jgi:hypothetical protein
VHARRAEQHTFSSGEPNSQIKNFSVIKPFFIRKTSFQMKISYAILRRRRLTAHNNERFHELNRFHFGDDVRRKVRCKQPNKNTLFLYGTKQNAKHFVVEISPSDEITICISWI